LNNADWQRNNIQISEMNSKWCAITDFVNLQ
jgi:hypothetical protein